MFSTRDWFTVPDSKSVFLVLVQLKPVKYLFQLECNCCYHCYNDYFVEYQYLSSRLTTVFTQCRKQKNYEICTQPQMSIMNNQHLLSKAELSQVAVEALTPEASSQKRYWHKTVNLAWNVCNPWAANSRIIKYHPSCCNCSYLTLVWNCLSRNSINTKMETYIAM